METNITVLTCAPTPKKLEAGKLISEEVTKITTYLPHLHPSGEIYIVNGGYGAYNTWCIKELGKCSTSPYILTIENDGRILNPKAWDDNWLKYDYIGAPWPDGVTGNGGFSLRSARLCEYISTNLAQFYNGWNGIPDNEDYFICRTMRKRLEDAGFRFAPYEVASKFSVEHGEYTGQFGAHHDFTLKGRYYNLKKGTVSPRQVVNIDLF